MRIHSASPRRLCTRTHVPALDPSKVPTLTLLFAVGDRKVETLLYGQFAPRLFPLSAWTLSHMRCQDGRGEGHAMRPRGQVHHL